jgi:shikimate kinase
MTISAEDGPRLILVGMMGAGKTAVGKAVADRLGWPYLDNDNLVGEAAGVDAPELAASRGVEELHRVEVAVAEAVLGRPGPLVAGVAGYCVTDPRVVRLLRERARVAWLRARPATLRARIGGGAGRRDDARSLAWIEVTVADREAAFAAVADLVVDVDDRDVAGVAGEIAAWIAAGAARTGPG